MKIPKNISLEQFVIAGMMNNDECFYEGISKLGTSHFTTDENIRLFDILKDKRTMPSAKLIEKEVSEPKIKSAIRTIDSTWTNASDFFQALDSLDEIYKKRCLYYSIEKISSKFDEEDHENLTEELSDEIADINLGIEDEEIILPQDGAVDFLTRFLDVYSNPDMSMGVPYSIMDDKGRIKGLPSLDETFNGAKGGDLVMIAAKTGEGKSAFAINLARIFSLYQDYKGYYENTEMNVDEIKSRLLSPLSSSKANEIETGRLEGSKQEQDDKVSRISNAAEQYRVSNLAISRLPYLPLYKAKGLAKQTKRKLGGLDYLVVDYVGRMEMDHDKNIWDELYRITQGLKQLAIELNIPIFMLAQRNQAGDVEGAKKMMNECDGVLYFEPTTEEDWEFIQRHVRSDQQRKVNYRIIKKKVRRNDNSAPIYCMFDKSKSLVAEAKKP